MLSGITSNTYTYDLCGNFRKRFNNVRYMRPEHLVSLYIKNKNRKFYFILSSVVVSYNILSHFTIHIWFSVATTAPNAIMFIVVEHFISSFYRAVVCVSFGVLTFNFVIKNFKLNFIKHVQCICCSVMSSITTAKFTSN